MKITLRKANALQTVIQDHIKAIEVKTQVTLNEFQDAQSELARARDLAAKNDQRRAGLTRALYRVRAAIGRQNVYVGISDLLAESVYVDKRISQIKGLIEGRVAEADAVIAGKLDKIRNDKGEGRRTIYGYNDTVESGVLTEADVEGYRAQMLALKKEKQSINDKVLELNVRTDVELDDETVALLQGEQLV